MPSFSRLVQKNALYPRVMHLLCFFLGRTSGIKQATEIISGFLVLLKGTAVFLRRFSNNKLFISCLAYT